MLFLFRTVTGFRFFLFGVAVSGMVRSPWSHHALLLLSPIWGTRSMEEVVHHHISETTDNSRNIMRMRYADFPISRSVVGSTGRTDRGRRLQRIEAPRTNMSKKHLGQGPNLDVKASSAKQNWVRGLNS